MTTGIGRTCNAQARARAPAGANAHAQAQAHTHAGAHANAQAHAGTHANAQAHADANAQARAHANGRARACAVAGSLALLAFGAPVALAQPTAADPGFLEHDALTPPLLFREVWQQPPHTGPLTDENRRITPQALTNPDLQLTLYGKDAANIQVTAHNGVPDLWNGFTTSPVALTLKHKGAYLDLTGLTRMRWRTRTENLHVLHPVVKLADGVLLVGSQTFESPQRPMVGSKGFTGNFVVSEVTFDDQRWFELDPDKVVVKLEVANPDLSRVDEIGYVDLMPGGGHGTAGCTNVSWIEVYAAARKR